MRKAQLLLTDDHDGELDTLLDFVAPASASERHDGKMLDWEVERDEVDDGDCFFVVEQGRGGGR